MPTPSNIPWYKSAIMQGLIASIVAQALARSNLASVITSDEAVGIINWALDGISAAAIAYAAHARALKPIPTITTSKAKADAANAAQAAPLDSSPSETPK